MKSKEKVFSTFVRWKTIIEKQIERKIKCFRIDNELGFYYHEFDDFCSTEEIARHCTYIGTTQHNGIAERMNKTFYDRTRNTLSHSGVG